MAKKKPATVEEKEHMGKVASLGCIVCRNLGRGKIPPEVHHIRSGVGMGRRASHYETIPLCAPHHRTGGYGVAYHAGKKGFEDNFGTERELLEQTLELIKKL